MERVNEYAPQHSRIFKEVGAVIHILAPDIDWRTRLQMILVTSPEKPFEYTAKNDTRRHAIVAMYEGEIDALYAAVNETTQADLKPPMSWSQASAKAFVRAVVERVLDRPLGDQDDLFQNSCDRYATPLWFQISV